MGLIECKGISKRFGEKVALDNVSVDIPKGQIFGLLGPNGAGKTTLIRIINRITIPNSGEVIFDGHPITQSDVASSRSLLFPDVFVSFSLSFYLPHQCGFSSRDFFSLQDSALEGSFS